PGEQRLERVLLGVVIDLEGGLIEPAINRLLVAADAVSRQRLQSLNDGDGVVLVLMHEDVTLVFLKGSSSVACCRRERLVVLRNQAIEVFEAREVVLRRVKHALLLNVRLDPATKQLMLATRRVEALE